LTDPVLNQEEKKMKTLQHDVRKRLPVSLMIFMLAALLLQACGGATPTAQVTTAPIATQAPAATEAPSATEAPAVTEAPAATEATAATEAPAATQPPATVERSGTLNVAVQPLVQTDPALISSDPEVFAANHIYDYLVDVTPDNTIAPRLATEWTTSEDGLTYTFQLAQGVTFHDGSPFSANDVVWTFDRLRDPNTGSPTADLYSNIDSIEATGDLEVTFKLTKSNPFFLYDLSDNHALVLKADTQDPTQFNGTGPFKVIDYSPEDRLSLEANPNYFIPGQPKLAGLELIFFSDQTAMVDALRSGQVDLVMALPTEIYTGLKDQDNINLFEVPTNQFDLVRLRADREPGNKPEVIQALKLATDRQAVYDLVQQGFGKIGRDSPIGPMYKQYYSEETPLPQRDIGSCHVQRVGGEPGAGRRENMAVAGDVVAVAVGVDQNVDGDAALGGRHQQVVRGEGGIDGETAEAGRAVDEVGEIAHLASGNLDDFQCHGAHQCCWGGSRCPALTISQSTMRKTSPVARTTHSSPSSGGLGNSRLPRKTSSPSMKPHHSRAPVCQILVFRLKAMRAPCVRFKFRHDTRGGRRGQHKARPDACGG
jgi:hypothetical protein